jgi:hypothetical protein
MGEYLTDSFSVALACIMRFIYRGEANSKKVSSFYVGLSAMSSPKTAAASGTALNEKFTTSGLVRSSRVSLQCPNQLGQGLEK